MSSASAFSRLLPRSHARRFTAGAALFAAALVVLAASSVLAQVPTPTPTPGTRDMNFTTGIFGSTTYSIYRYDYVDVVGTPQDFLVQGGDLFLFDRVVLPDGLENPEDNKPDFGIGNRIVYTIVQDKYINPDKFFIGGSFGQSNTQVQPKDNIYRVNSDFTLDTPAATDKRPVFDPGTGADTYVIAILPTADGKLVVGGQFSTFNNASHLHIVRLTDNANAFGVPDGTIDSTFDPNLSFDQPVLTLAEQLDPATAQPNGQILVGGQFDKVDGKPAAKLARINNDGSVDTTFKPGIDLRVNTVTVQPDGKILIGGDFTTINGVAESHLARLNFDGSVDTTFTGSVTDQVTENNVNPVSVYTVVLLADGRMYVGGNFLQVNGTVRRYLALLDADGSVDPTFDPGTVIINSVQCVLPDTTSTGDVFVGETLSSEGTASVIPPSLIALYPPPVNTPVFTNAPPIPPTKVPQFFSGEAVLGGGYFYLAFANGNAFGYYDLDFRPYLYHVDLGFEYVIDADDGKDGIYLYDFASNTFFYTSPTYPFPYLYDFSLNTVLYYFPVATITTTGFAGYTTNPRYFYDFATGTIITK